MGVTAFTGPKGIVTGNEAALQALASDGRFGGWATDGPALVTCLSVFFVFPATRFFGSVLTSARLTRLILPSARGRHLTGRGDRFFPALLVAV